MNKDKRNNIKLLGTLNNSDESGIIANANQIYDANEDKSTQDVSKEHTERIETLETKESSMQTTLENISKTGEASAASNVTYNHSDSKLDATNVQQAVDEVHKRSNYNDGDNIIDFNTIHLITDNPEFAIAAVDINDKILYGIKADGQPCWGVGVPKAVKDYVDKQVNDILGTDNITETIDSLKEVEKFLSDFKNSDTLKALLDTKANKVDIANDVVNLYTLLKPTTIGIKGDSSIEYRINTTDCAAVTLLIKNTSDNSGYFRIACYDASDNCLYAPDILIDAGKSYESNIETSAIAYIIITSINSRTGELTVTKDTNAIDNIKDLDKRTTDNENATILNKNILVDRVIPTDIYGYINTNGSVNIKTSGNNRCSDFFPVEQGSMIEYSGYYTYGGFPAVYGYDENKQPVTQLLPTGPQYTNYIITIDNTSIRYVRAWGDISQGALSIKVLAQHNISDIEHNISDIEHNISDIDSASQLFRNNFVENNISTDLFGYIDSKGSINIQTSGNNHRTDYIPVEQGDRILYTGYYGAGMSAVYGYDENKQPIAKLLATGDWANKIVEIDDSTIKYVMAWGDVSSHNLSVKILPKYNAKKLSTIEIVDANGNGDYLTLEEAIWNNISDRGDVTKHRTIIVMPGVYTMNTYYGNDSHFWKVIENRNLSIIGTDRNACILKNTKGKYIAGGSNRIDDACLKLSGNVLIKNLTLLASHEDFDGAEGTHPVAYCIHLDSGGADCNLEIDNCIMSNKQSACIGIGTADNYTIQIRNCKLITNVDDPSSFTSWSGAIICHNNDYSNAATLRLENNVMRSNTPNTLAIVRSGSRTSPIKLEAYRNIIGGNVSIDSGIVVLDELNFGNNKSELNYQS